MTPNNHLQLDFARDIDFSRILTNPILDIAARLWDGDRYHAFKVCYRSMRRIDDLVDHRKEQNQPISPEEITDFTRALKSWMKAVRSGKGSDDFHREFLGTMEQFVIPFWPWERLVRAMIYDLNHDGFPTLLQFVRYTEGAAIAPASVFMHLCGLSNSGDYLRPPRYDIRYAARPLALFSYFVHIIRDFQKDQLSNLNYFADSLLSRCRVDRASLRLAAEDGHIDSAVRDLITSYKSIAEYYRLKARVRMDEIKPFLDPRYQLSYEMIYSLYLQIFERIDPVAGHFTTEELNPPPEEVAARIQSTIATFTPTIA
jgi:phytoene/squalene synthetase